MVYLLFRRLVTLFWSIVYHIGSGIYTELPLISYYVNQIHKILLNFQDNRKE